MGWLNRLLWGRSRTVLDARGQRRELFDPFERFHAQERADFGPAQFSLVKSEAEAAQKQSVTYSGGLMLFVWMFVLLGVIRVFVWISRGASPRDWIGGIVMVVVGFGIVLLAKYGIRASPGRVAWAMLNRQRCPTCAYDLRGQVSSDKVVTCPECGAAWELPDPINP